MLISYLGNFSRTKWTLVIRHNQKASNIYKSTPLIILILDHSVMAHINRLKMMADELNSIECHVSEQALIVRILQTLPPSFRHFLSVWDSVSPADRTLVNLTARLVTEELRSKSLNDGQADPVDVAFFASHPNRVKKEAVANAAHSRDPRGNYNHRNNNSNYRDNKQYYRDDSRVQSSRHRDNQSSQHNYRGNHRGRRSGYTNRGCYICGLTNHKAINCYERKNDERREARGNKFHQNRDSKRDNNNNNDDSKESFAALSSVCFLARKPSYWYADTGASHHMTNQRSYFTSFKEIPYSWTVSGIGGVQVKALGVGTVPIVSHINGESKAGILHEVLFVPELGTNLFSVGIATDHGIEAHFAKDGATFVKNGIEVMSGKRLGKSLYHLNVTATNSFEDCSTAIVATKSNRPLPLSLIHQRLAHLNNAAILKMLRTNAVTGLNLDPSTKHTPCEGCIFGKSCRTPFCSSTTKSDGVGHIIHSDIGEVPIPTPNNEVYYVVFKDDFSNWTSIVCMKRKSDATKLLMKFIAFVKRATGRDVRIVRTDGGKEYDNDAINNFFTAEGIVHQTTVPYTPQQNGVSERLNRTAMESARSMMHMRTNKFTNLFKKADRSILELWGEFLRSAVYVLNRTLSCSASSNSSSKTPHELFFNQKPDIGHLRIIGCRGYPLIPKAKHRKLDPKGIPCWLVGYGEETKGWRLWDPVTRKIILSRDVTFDENLLISDFKEDSDPHASRQSQFNLINPYLLASKILGLPTECDSQLTPADEEQHVPENPATEPMEEDPHQQDSCQDYTTPVDENAEHNLLQQPLGANPEPHPTAPQHNEAENLRRTARPHKYTARYEEFRRSLGLTATIKNSKTVISLRCLPNHSSHKATRRH